MMYKPKNVLLYILMTFLLNVLTSSLLSIKFIPKILFHQSLEVFSIAMKINRF